MARSMSSNDGDSSLPTTSPRAPDKQKAPKRAITRTRTGCFTCRRRRKKCGEQKPACYQCERIGAICEGYPKQTVWTSKNSKSQQPELHSTTSASSTEDFLAPQDRRSSIGSVGTNASIATLGSTALTTGNRSFDYDMGHRVSPGSIDAALTQISTTSRVEDDSENDLALQPYQQHQRFAPRSLPFIIPGVVTPIHRRLFHHFAQHVVNVMTINDGTSPLQSIILPAAADDVAIMQSLLALSASHLAKVKEGDLQVAFEKRNMQSMAIDSQMQRLGQLTEHPTRRSRLRETELALISSLMLCLFEICEGSGNSQVHTHLKVAREVVQKAAIDSDMPNTEVSTVTKDMDPFLIEFFVYHDALAAVTGSGDPLMADFRTESVQPGWAQPFAVSSNDGLYSLVAKIASFAKRVEAADEDHRGKILCEAVDIWQELDRWTPESTDFESKIVGKLYQWGLFIWLFSTIYPDGIEQEQVQQVVRNAITHFSDVQSSAMSCLLFPLFVVGCATIDPDQRASIDQHFERVSAWSHLGNIKLAQQVVHHVWTQHDAGIARSWDWMQQLRTRGINFLVT